MEQFLNVFAQFCVVSDNILRIVLLSNKSHVKKLLWLSKHSFGKKHYFIIYMSRYVKYSAFRRNKCYFDSAETPLLHFTMLKMTL